MLFGLLLLPHLALGEVVTVAPGPGTGAHCESLHCAQDRVRQLLRVPSASEGAAEDITVRVAGGSYELMEPLVFDERDHATDGRRVVWQGPAAGASHAARPARILGGTRLRGWERAWGEVYRTRLGRRVWNLAENGRQSNPARHPNTNPGAGSGQLNGSASMAGITWNEVPAAPLTLGCGKAACDAPSALCTGGAAGKRQRVRLG